MLCGIGQQGHKAGLLERTAQCALVLGAGACLAARLDLAAIGDVAFQEASGIFIIDLPHAVVAELADLTPGATDALAAPRASGGLGLSGRLALALALSAGAAGWRCLALALSSLLGG